MPDCSKSAINDGKVRHKFLGLTSSSGDRQVAVTFDMVLHDGLLTSSRQAVQASTT